jgi:Amiloride-sensitive sodium channel
MQLTLKLIKMETSFVKEVSIHGIRFIGDTSSPKSIRIFWTASFLISIAGLAYYGHSVYTKWNFEPDIGLRVSHRAIDEIPFPAITVCSPLFARDGLANLSAFLENFGRLRLKNFAGLTANEQNFLAAGNHKCNYHLANKVGRACGNRTRSDVVQLLAESSLNVSEAFASCGFRRIFVECATMFKKVMTHYGFCYAFNSIDYWRLFNGKMISSDFDSYKGEESEKIEGKTKMFLEFTN